MSTSATHPTHKRTLIDKLKAFPGLAAKLALLGLLIALGLTVFGDHEVMFNGLGTHTRPIATSSRKAQRYFNQGLAFLYAFNHDEAIRSFQKAADLDPECAMAWWGIAMANGPHINNPQVPKGRAEAAWAAAQKAKQFASTANPADQALIKAVESRFAEDPVADRKPLDQAYADAMREVWKEHPGDADIGAMFAESMMDLRPWDLYTQDQKPQPGTDEIVATLEKVMEFAPLHPLALHLYIHAVEASKTPARADLAANRLRNLQPGLGHMVHMPSHIDVRRGRWQQSIGANARAIAADDAYRRQSPQQEFYRIYMAHNHHMLAFSAMMCGQKELAINTINQMVQDMPAEWIAANPILADGFLAQPIEVLIRFGRWDQVLRMPEMPESLPISRTMRRCARGIAYAAKGDLASAKAEQEAFLAEKKRITAEGIVGNNKGADVTDVAEHLLAGEILYREGKVDEGLAELRKAVKLEDQLRYSEPPDWMHPVRHALGATLLKEGKALEAENVYREDLAKLPGNGWALYGLAQSFELQGKVDEANRARKYFDQVWKSADTQISSSCFCQPGEE